MAQLFHITHVSNLVGIIGSKGLVSSNQISRNSGPNTNIGHYHIKERRSTKMVPVAPGGFVADYVPFYFAPRSPMLYSIHKGNVQQYQNGQREIIYLVTDSDLIFSSQCQYCFCDGHATMEITKFYNSPDSLADAIDWEIMQAQYWNNTDNDTDRTRRRAAEFLVKDFLPFNLIQEISTYDIIIKSDVDAILAANGICGIQVTVKTSWYY